MEGTVKIKRLQDAAIFQLGSIMFTPGAMQEIPPEAATIAVCRHARGDWGDVCEVDRQENEDSLKNGWQLFSVYHTDNGLKFWIITEADRSYTTVLLPSEY